MKDLRKRNYRDVNAELYARCLDAVHAQLTLLRKEVDDDAALSARLDPQQSDECRLLSLDIGRKLRTINDWRHDIQLEYGLPSIRATNAEHPPTVEGEVIDAAH